MNETYLERMVSDINRTHPGMGNLICMCMLGVRAKKCILVVAPTGTGKSYSQKALQKVIVPYWQGRNLTLTGLESFEGMLSGYDGLIVIDDLAAIENDYTRMNTITTLTELCHEHETGKHTGRAQFEIKDFHGSALINIQPKLLMYVVKSIQWDTFVQDKVIRYYHMYRPTIHNDDIPLIEPPAPEPEELPKLGKIDGKIQQQLETTSVVQWGRARARQHIIDLLQATASYNEHEIVTNEDAAFLNQVLKPLRVERWLMEKNDFEGERTFNNSLYCLMVEWATYGSFAIEDLMIDYHVSQPTAYRLLDQSKRFWQPIINSPKRYSPVNRPVYPPRDATMLDILKDVGIDWKE